MACILVQSLFNIVPLFIYFFQLKPVTKRCTVTSMQSEAFAEPTDAEDTVAENDDPAICIAMVGIITR